MKQNRHHKGAGTLQVSDVEFDSSILTATVSGHHIIEFYQRLLAVQLLARISAYPLDPAFDSVATEWALHLGQCNG